MRFQDRAIAETNRIMESLFRTARAVPEDKLNWKPLDQARSVIDQLQECAQAPRLFIHALKHRNTDFDEDQMARWRDERQGWTTLEACEMHCKANTEALNALIAELSDAELDETLTAGGPNGPRELSLASVALAHHNNMLYHVGQINYVQTLYGDFDPH